MNAPLNEDDHRPMSLEQIRLIGHETEHASRKVFHTYLRGAIAAYLVVLSVVALNFFRVDNTIERINDLREERVVLTQRSDAIICNNQTEILRRLIEANSVLRTLTSGFSKMPGEGVSTANQRERQRLLVEADRKLTMGIISLESRVRKLDCESLPGNAPFRR